MDNSFIENNNEIPMATAVAVEAPTGHFPPTAAAASMMPSLTPLHIIDGQQQQQQQNYEKNSKLPLVLARSRPTLDEYQYRILMEEHGFTRGLSQSLEEMMDRISLRIWIIDNSGSMQKADGNRFVPKNKSNSNYKKVECTRWEEIQDCLNYHIRLVGLLKAPTRFRLLNGVGGNTQSQHYFSVAEQQPDDPHRIDQEVQNGLQIMRNTRPGGYTPLTSHIREIYQEVSQMAPELRRLGKEVAIVIATDGLPTTCHGYAGPEARQEFVDSLRLLQGLPVWVVVRLCTDEEDVVEFYSQLDNQLELALDVLDDFSGEAIEVTKENPWLNYAFPLHRLREMGYHERVFDMLDERKLTRSEIRDFCNLLFGNDNMDGIIADPSGDWKGFVKDIDRIQRRETPQWNPLSKKVQAWINLSKLKKAHSKRWF